MRNDESVKTLSRESVSIVSEKPSQIQHSITRKRFVYRLKISLIQLWESKMAFLGAIIVLGIVVMGTITPLIEMHDPLEMNISNRLAKPSFEHILGTDDLGRDIWSRLVHGGRTALVVGGVVVLVSLLCSLPLGALTGYYGGWADN
ncbi:MAG: hypothetical protein HY731_07770, partial [Candidatus Tectomicrobia bacterium]|nr:hypothetical protein [Candidatus Tectomicrobia bacterium]